MNPAHDTYLRIPDAYQSYTLAYSPDTLPSYTVDVGPHRITWRYLAGDLYIITVATDDQVDDFGYSNGEHLTAHVTELIESLR